MKGRRRTTIFRPGLMSNLIIYYKLINYKCMDNIMKCTPLGEQKSLWLRKTLLIMKFFVLFLLLGTVPCWAGIAYSQNVKMSLDMENTSTPTALIFSRQNIANLPAGNDYSQAAKGAYIVAGSDENPDVILVASGSEVSTLEAGAELLRKDGIKIRIVSAPSEGLFRSQSKEYQNSIIPTGAKVFGLTAGLPVNLEGLVGANGKVFGLESFGFSAPYKVLDEKLGFTAQNVYNQVKEMLA